MTTEPEAPQSERGCPDGGTCHHSCVPGCWRVIACEPLSGVYEGDKWPSDVLTAHAVARYQMIQRPEDKPGPLKPLKAAIAGHLARRYGPAWRARPAPPGLRLEVSHGALHSIMQDPDSWDFNEASLFSDYRTQQQFYVPLRVNGELPEGAWRLVIVTEEVLLSGKLGNDF